MSTKTLRISGMTCDHCAQSVEQTLNALPGVKAFVSFQEGIARIKSSGAAGVQTWLEAVASKGYSAKLVDEGDVVATEDDGGRLQVAVIGTGSGACAGALQAASEGAQVTMIEAGTIGGTCVNVGCVPSKITIRTAHITHLMRDNPFDGISNVTPSLDRPALVAQQQARVDELRYAKYENIIETNPDINLIKGRASFHDANTLLIKREDGTEKYLPADRILIATGAKPALPLFPDLPILPIGHQQRR